MMQAHKDFSMKGKKSLSTLIGVYQRMHGPRLDEYLTAFHKLGSLEEAIKVVYFEKGVKIHRHQRRIGGEILLKKVVPALLRHADGIAGCQAFDDLHGCIKDLTKDISRFGALAVYDTALRLGALRDLWPKVVYLHAGTKKGCKALGVPTSGSTIEIAELPEPLPALKPYHAENFLCIFKDRLSGAGGRVTGCLPSPGGL